MEDALEAFGGTSIIVSHDRYFLDKVTTRILEMEKGKVTEYLGNYTYYKEKKKDLLAFNADRNGKPAEAKEKKTELAHKSKDVKIEKQTAPAKGDLLKLEKTEMEINRLEATMKMYDMQLGSGMTNYEEIAEQYTDIKTIYKMGRTCRRSGKLKSAKQKMSYLRISSNKTFQFALLVCN